MKYYTESENYFSYSTHSKYRRRSFQSLMTSLRMHKTCAAFVSTAVYRRFFMQQYIMVLDCDSIEESICAIHCLKTIYHIDYCTIQSSPGKFWIVTDYIGSAKNIVNLMRQIPGVDEKFVDKCYDQGMVTLRAMPKSDIYPEIPIFPDQIELSSPHIRRWVNELKAYWENPILQETIKIRRIRESIKNKSTYEMIADPDFVV